MKYGWRERISGAIILVALGAIFLPMLFDDPEPREEEPAPVMVIEQPVSGGETRQTIIESPQPSESVASNTGANTGGGGQGASGQGASGQPTNAQSNGNAGAVPEPDTRGQLSGDRSGAFGQEGDSSDPIAEIAASEPTAESQPAREPEPEPAPEPQPASNTAERTPASSNGGWVVQVGSFGQPDNAAGLSASLQEQGFPAYSQPRDNNLTTVYVGPFDSSDAGEAARGELKQAANIQGLLIRKPGG